MQTYAVTPEQRRAHEDLWERFHPEPEHLPVSLRVASNERFLRSRRVLLKVHYDPSRRAKPACGISLGSQHKITHEPKEVTCELCLATMERALPKDDFDDE